LTEQTIPAPVRRSAIAVPGSGIEVELLAGGFVYMLKLGGIAGAGTGAGVGTGAGAGVGTGNRGIGSGVTAAGDGLGVGLGVGLGDETIGSGVGLGASIGAGSAGAVCADLAVAQGLEKFPGPHTSTAVAGGAAAR